MTESEKTPRRPSPTYLSAPRIAKVIELISKRNLNEVGPDYFERYGFGASDATLAIGTLKFLGVLDETGKSTEKMRSLQLLGEPRQKAFQQILRESYSELFETTGEPYNLPSDELINEFMHSYRVSPRLAKPAAVAFQKLSEFAGWREETSATPRERAKGAKPKTPAKPISGANRETQSQALNTQAAPQDSVPFRLADGKVVLYVPQEILNRAVLDEDVSSEFRAIMQSLKAFCAKYVPEDRKDEEEVEEVDD
jgi:hypothetical protein